MVSSCKHSTVQQERRTKSGSAALALCHFPYLAVLQTTKQMVVNGRLGMSWLDEKVHILTMLLLLCMVPNLQAADVASSHCS
jgi:hypothetical protein